MQTFLLDLKDEEIFHAIDSYTYHSFNFVYYYFISFLLFSFYK